MRVNRYRAPEFPDHLEWLNVDRPVSLKKQGGSVVLLAFGTWSSVPCQHMLADLDYLENRYRDKLAIIGIHAARFPHEKSREHLQKSICRNHIHHPVINDSGLQLSNIYGIRKWPSVVVIDTSGLIVGALTGEGKRARLDKIIQTLLESGRQHLAIVRDRPEERKCDNDSTGPLSFPGKVLVSGSRIYIADSGHNRILETTEHGHIVRQFGSDNGGFNDGSCMEAAFNNPQGMVLTNEFLYVADTGNHAIRRIRRHGGEVETIAGTGSVALSPQGDYFTNPAETDLNSPTGLAISRNVIYIAMTGLHQIWAHSLITNTLEIFAGSGREGIVDGISRNACFAQPSALALMDDTLFVADAKSSAIRAVDLGTRQVSTLVGRSLCDCGDNDGHAAVARMQFPLDIHADPNHKLLWVADTYNNKIKRIETRNKLVSSIPVNHRLDEPGGLAFNGDSLYIANTNFHEIVRLNLRNGKIQALNVNNDSISI
jgi:DNA-binding beta-propeller fold protein YncE